MSQRDDKRQLRARVRRLRGSLAPDARAEKSRRACEVLTASPLWHAAQRVALFRSMPDEVSTEPLFEEAWRSGRQVALPITPALGRPLDFRWVRPDTVLVQAAFGMLEPAGTAPVAPYGALQLVVTPGLAFDARGARLGYGGGYYDRTLARIQAPAVMLAFACQGQVSVPEEGHDVRMQAVVTEDGWMRPLSP